MSEKKLYQPTQLQTKEDFFQGTIQNIYNLFEGVDEDNLSLQFFTNNTDHGLEHEYHVYQKAMEIAQKYEEETGISIRKDLIYAMSIFHDAMRSVQYDESDPQKIRKEKRNDKNHEKYGAVLFEKLIEKIQSQNDLKKQIQFSPEEKEDISEYLINHDFFSEQLNGKRFHEPKSKEGQIVRLADRISIPLKDEIQRYRDTGKRLGTPFFNTTVSLDERENFSFDNMGYYFKNGKIDEVLFFTALLMITEKDFNDPLLGQIYKERASQKKDAVQFIMDIADKEDTNPKDKQQLQELLTHLGKKFGFSL